jgi:hypothetical protein
VRVWEALRDQVVTDLDETRRLVLTVIYGRDALEGPILFGTILQGLVRTLDQRLEGLRSLRQLARLDAS